MHLLLAINLINDVLPDGVLGCFNAYEVLDSIGLAVKDKRIIVCNDCHTKLDKEIEYIPPHAILGTCGASPLMLGHLPQQRTVLHKTSFSAITNRHNAEIISRFDDISLCGFYAGWDILATAYSLMSIGKNVKVIESAIGDIDSKQLDSAKFIMRNLGILV